MVGFWSHNIPLLLLKKELKCRLSTFGGGGPHRCPACSSWTPQLNLHPCMHSALWTPPKLNLRPCMHSALWTPPKLNLRPCMHSALWTPPKLNLRPCMHSALWTPPKLNLRPCMHNALWTPPKLNLRPCMQCPLNTTQVKPASMHVQCLIWTPPKLNLRPCMHSVSFGHYSTASVERKMLVVQNSLEPPCGVVVTVLKK